MIVIISALCIGLLNQRAHRFGIHTGQGTFSFHPFFKWRCHKQADVFHIILTQHLVCTSSDKDAAALLRLFQNQSALQNEQDFVGRLSTQLLVVLVVPDTVQPRVRLLFIHRRQLFCWQAALFDYLIQQFLVPKINLQILCQTFCNLMSATSKFSSYADDHFHFLLLVLFYPVFYPPPDHKTMVKSSTLWNFGHLGQFVGLSSATFPLPLLYSPV